MVYGSHTDQSGAGRGGHGARAGNSATVLAGRRSVRFGFQDGFGLIHTNLVVVSGCFRTLQGRRLMTMFGTEREREERSLPA